MKLYELLIRTDIKSRVMIYVESGHFDFANLYEGLLKNMDFYTFQIIYLRDFDVKGQFVGNDGCCYISIIHNKNDDDYIKMLIKNNEERRKENNE